MVGLETVSVPSLSGASLCGTGDCVSFFRGKLFLKLDNGSYVGVST